VPQTSKKHHKFFVKTSPFYPIENEAVQGQTVELLTIAEIVAHFFFYTRCVD
jgi:hypothetical protein